MEFYAAFEDERRLPAVFGDDPILGQGRNDIQLGIEADEAFEKLLGGERPGMNGGIEVGVRSDAVFADAQDASVPGRIFGIKRAGRPSGQHHGGQDGSGSRRAALKI